MSSSSPSRPKRGSKPRLAASRRPQLIAAAIVSATLLAGFLVVRSEISEVLAYPQTPLSDVAQTVEFEIPRGSGLTQAIALLSEHKLLADSHPMMFKLYVLHAGASNQIRAGRHVFRRDMTPGQILEELKRKPAADTYRVTLPEGRHHVELAEIIAKAGGPSVQELLTAMRDRKLLEEYEIPGDTVEGYLFPDTYRLTRGMSAQAIVRKLVEQHFQVYEAVRRSHSPQAVKLERELSWHQREIVTLASIVEKETGVPKERPLIAGVFLNRLRFSSFRPKRLETDPTIIYGCTVAEPKSPACQKWEGRIRTIHLRDKDNPYNTYTHEGLPPGPISNPGRAAIEAVFDPTPSKYLYFVSRNDGTHHFSSSIAEHEAAVEKHMRQGVVGDG